MASYTHRIRMFDGSSAQSSTLTSASAFVGDFTHLSLSWHTDDDNASRLTLWGSNDDGFQSAITNWSVITGYAAASQTNARGAVGGQEKQLTAGGRWCRFTRDSNESLCVVDIALLAL